MGVTKIRQDLVTERQVQWTSFDNEHLFIYLFAICIPSLGIFLIMSSAQFLFRLIFTFEIRKFIIHSRYSSFANIISYLLACLFFLTVFTEQSLFEGKMNKIGGIRLPNFKTYYTASLNKIMRYCQRETETQVNTTG